MKARTVHLANIANVLTFFRLTLVPVFLIFLMQHTTRSSVIALIIFAAASATDYFDGLLARKRQLQTPLGEFMDPLADKLLVCGAFVAFSLMPVLNISWWLVALILFREVFVTVMRVAALRRNAPIKTEYSGKIKTCIQMVTIVAILILLILYRETGVLKGGVAAIPPALVVLSALIALISMVQYVIRNRHVFTRQAEY